LAVPRGVLIVRYGLLWKYNKENHVTLSIVNKLKVIEEMKAGVSLSKIVEKFNIAKQTLSNIEWNKESLRLTNLDCSQIQNAFPPYNMV
jgi:hypothetical protein